MNYYDYHYGIYIIYFLQDSNYGNATVEFPGCLIPPPQKKRRKLKTAYDTVEQILIFKK